MTRAAPAWAGAVVVGLVLVGVSAVVLFLESRSSSAPTADECARVWNAVENRPNQEIVAAADPSQAIVYGWMAKDRYPGCGVSFLDGQGGPWLSFGRFMNAETPAGKWDLVRGERWGFDNPEGPPDETNAKVSTDGKVVLGTSST